MYIKKKKKKKKKKKIAIVSNLWFIYRTHFMLSWYEHEKFYNLGTWTNKHRKVTKEEELQQKYGLVMVNITLFLLVKIVREIRWSYPLGNS